VIIDKIKEELRHFLRDDEHTALCLTGKWGVGKTFLWEMLLKEAFQNNSVKPTRYAYVSLFGLNSLTEVRRALFHNTLEAQAFREGKPPEATVESAAQKLTALSARWRAGVSLLRGIPVVSDYSALAEQVGFLDVRDQIVCLDDMERMGDDLRVNDVFGLISQLKEKKRCKIILILNSEALEGACKDDYRSQIEKIIDAELVYLPTPDNCAAIAFPDFSEQRAQWVKENVIALGISNIRTIMKLDPVSRRLADVLRDYDPQVLKQALHSACLYGFALYQPKDAPPVTMIADDRPLAQLWGDSDEKTPEEIKWSELLRDYKFHNADDFDLTIFDCMRTGVYDVQRLREKADIAASQYALQAQDAAFTSVWDFYHGSFDDNGDEFAEMLKASILENACAIGASNFSASIEILKKLGHGDAAADLITKYIEVRKDDTAFWESKLVAPRLRPLDPDVQAAFEAQAAKFQEGRTLRGTLFHIAKKEGWSAGTLEFVDQHSAEDFYRLLKETKGEELRTVVNGLTYFRRVSNADHTMQSITEKAVEALKRIGNENALNACRVRGYGIVLDNASS
jgi:hypothetical protein